MEMSTLVYWSSRLAPPPCKSRFICGVFDFDHVRNRGVGSYATLLALRKLYMTL